MALRPVSALPAIPGRIWLSSMPGRFESWDGFLQQARQAGITDVVCLTPRHEIAAISPHYDRALDQGRLPFGWIHLPMRNLGLANEARAFHDGIDDVAQRVRAGGSVLLHCAAGIGRTGTAAACLLKRLGVSSELALQRVRDAGSNPETAVQTDLISTF